MSNPLKIVNNSVSEDFPLRIKYENVAFQPEPKIVHTHKTIGGLNYFNNETPALFRLDYMKPKKDGYNNPFLDEVLKVDRSEEFKKMEFNKKQIELIDKIKSRREYSQNPKILRYIRSDFDIAMQDKREKNIQLRKEGPTNKKFVVSLDNLSRNKTEENQNMKTEGDSNTMQLKDTLNRLNKCGPKMSYKFKRNVCLTDSNVIPGDDLAKVGGLSCVCEPKKSGFMSNINDYSISEADKLDEKKFFYFPRKPEVRYNLIKDKVESIQGPPYPVPRWNAFYEK